MQPARSERVITVRRIVVGVDGSRESLAALRWALEDARFRGATVETVYVFENTPSWRLYGYREGAPAPTDHGTASPDLRGQDELGGAHARGLVEDMVDEVAGAEDVPTESVVVEDRHPARVLVDRSEGADMLVVGSRGRGGFSELLLGSVSHQCATHARCPVVIVRS